MERLKYIEILCLRVSDGLGTERDFKRLKAAGIDPNDWIGLPALLKKALRPPLVQDYSVEICNKLELGGLDLKEALSPKVIPNISSELYNRLDIGTEHGSPSNEYVHSPPMPLVEAQKSDGQTIQENRESEKDETKTETVSNPSLDANPQIVDTSVDEDLEEDSEDD